MNTKESRLQYFIRGWVQGMAGYYLVSHNVFQRPSAPWALFAGAAIAFGVANSIRDARNDDRKEARHE